jgi:hypothetical protein
MVHVVSLTGLGGFPCTSTPATRNYPYVAQVTTDLRIATWDGGPAARFHMVISR